MGRERLLIKKPIHAVCARSLYETFDSREWLPVFFKGQGPS